MPSRVTPSDGLEPVSLASASVGATGAVVSMTIALDPAMLLVPVGIVAGVLSARALLTRSSTLRFLKLVTLRSDDVSPAPTV